MRTDFPGGYLCQVGSDYRTLPYGSWTAGANRQERFRRKDLNPKGEVLGFHPDYPQHLSGEDSDEKDDILPLAKRLLQLVNYSSSRPIRLLGLSVSNATSEEARKEDKENSTLKPEYRELELEFEEWKEWERWWEGNERRKGDKPRIESEKQLTGIFLQLLFHFYCFFQKLTIHFPKLT